MRDEPRTLQGRHKSLVMYLRLEYIQHYEYSRQYGGKREDPPVAPYHICKETGQDRKERIPKPCLAHSTQRRPLQAYPKADDERCHNCKSSDAEPYRDASASSVLKGGRRPMFICTQRRHSTDSRKEDCRNPEPYEYIPSHQSMSLYRFLGPPTKSMNAPISIMMMPAKAQYFHGSLTI